MSPDPGGVEQAVSRTLRDNLAKLQQMVDELHQAVADLVAACASSRATNALPPMLRAQTAAAALSAALEVLSRFVTSALHPAQRTALEEQVLRVVSLPPPVPSPAPTMPPPTTPVPMGDAAEGGVAAASEAAGVTQAAPSAEVSEAPPPAISEAPFDLARLSPEEQEMHRRANRVAKVSMQDIRMLRPEQVHQGREHRDLCVRLRDDIEKAHKEYDRRFRPIMDHPVDYFYSWMVEILAGGDPEALGEYPYPSPVLRR